MGHSIAELLPGECEPTAEVVAAAAQWFVRLQDDDVSDQERAQCLRWRQANVTHDLAWRRLETLWRNFDDLEGQAAQPARATMAKLDARKRGKRRVKRTVGATICCIGVVVLLSDMMHRHLLADHHTGLARRETVMLPDGSQLTLDARSAVDVRYRRTERRVVLREGQILAQVNHDRDSRPFVIQTEQGTATALGTRYTVSLLDNTTQVSVLESNVRVCPGRSISTVCADLKQGQTANVETNVVSRIETSGYSDPSSWAQGYLALDNQSLSRVLHVLKSYHSGVMWYDERELESVLVSGVIPIEDSEQAFNILGRTLPIQIRQYMPWAVAIKKKK
ncbi:MAG: FecR family protein [Advenella sp.]|uniref:FecR family protein n=1 Tax=Advenella sp. TaxID=1872388 RepID=UPI003F9ABA95